MTIIHRVCATISDAREWCEPIGRRSVPAYRERRIDGWKGKAFSVALMACAMIGSGFPMTAWTADLSSLKPVKPRNVVAAGVGYETAETSLITVKTYDAESGAILSDETYELNVREDVTSADSQPRERIFAGGVGPGADGLSEFTLRVYDAATGRFLWEGLLNLNVGNQEFNSRHQVMAQLSTPTAVVTKTRSRSVSNGEPQFSLRTIDLVTGQLVWTDHFSAGAGSSARPNWVSRPVLEETEGSVLVQQIEFRIRMMDDQGRKIMWEDTFEPTVEETDQVAGQDAEAENLPVWRGEQTGEINKEAI